MTFKRPIKRKYMLGTTPIEPLKRTSALLKGPELFIKRDDLSLLAGGGNKSRKLEYLVADALRKGADTLVTCGAYQSNHARLTLAAAKREGLKCHLVLSDPTGHGRGAAEASGNLFLDRLLGADKIILKPKDTDLFQALDDEVDACTDAGLKPYAITLGGSSVLGCLGYVDCALEIAAHEISIKEEFDYIVVPVGSGGTMAGLIAGLREAGSKAKVLGINVLMKKVTQEPRIWQLVQQIADLHKIGASAVEEDVQCFDEGLGEGYALPTDEMREAVKLLAEKEGILLDPTYTGKAFAGLIALIRNGFFKPEDKVLFIHTGGSPALFEHQDWFVESNEMTNLPESEDTVE
ncbi:D-cysteine desulfhydrase family protein [Acidaminobacter hydrogenoformans]|uniref:D-cysteine desulfhydrase n=1 Tax=Acidaminobacter hydrogenoformans DSM 2784 TaxID=1120920 RepID=A0A1G5RRC2_9FIRM|nr:D-cysteine desulfhydrase [Acidaminobacter hydrogenoformans]SCZ76408.1 D-cysteine desulfhydrase [Acidaminobacter hydrogenoformans DSM 2784]